MTRLKIPLKFNKAPIWPTHLDPPALRYSQSTYTAASGASPQPVLDGRSILSPDIDLNDFRCTAVIDWIEVRMQNTPGLHQARNIHFHAKKMLDKLGSQSTIFVSGPDGETGYIGHDFILRLQQPVAREMMEFLEEMLQYYRPRNPTVMALPIAGTEVSVDFRVKPKPGRDQDASNLLRWRMADALRRHLRLGPVLTEEVRCAPRYYIYRNGRDTAIFNIDRNTSDLSGKLKVEATRLGLTHDQVVPLRRASHRSAPIDTTHYIGAEEFAVMLRVMDKTTDRRNPSSSSAVDLPPEEWRARIEVRLKNTDEHAVLGVVGLNTVGDLCRVDFKKMRKPFFEFFLPTVGTTCDTLSLSVSVSASETGVFARSGVYGLDRLHRSIEAINRARYAAREISTRPTKLGKKGRLMSYVELNRKVDRALRALSRHWRV